MPYLTITEYAEAANISRQAVYSRLDTKKIKLVPIKVPSRGIWVEDIKMINEPFNRKDK